MRTAVVANRDDLAVLLRDALPDLLKIVPVSAVIGTSVAPQLAPEFAPGSSQP
jgi:hypothetical protein